MQQQQEDPRRCGTFTIGTHFLTVNVPRSVFQIDFIGGLPIDRFAPANSNIFYTQWRRPISADNGGTHAPITSVLCS